MTHTGICYLVGSGPGDPGLITVRGLRCIREAEVIYYDHLVAPELLEEAPRDAALVYVGKEADRHSVPQDRIAAFICRDVREGKTVVRLKGGDPFVFGRGGEEAQALGRAGLSFEVVPGVTAGVAAPAYAGIPVTHRGVSTAATFVTGHEAPDKGGMQTDWEALGALSHTLCIYMGVRNLPTICERLMRGGRSPDEPVAVIESGTYRHQRCLTATLGTIGEVVACEGVKPPAMVVVGEVVNLRDSLQWYEPAPRCDRSNGKDHDGGPYLAVAGVPPGAV
ncbi:MAG: uroporphyrinogen-III C-methyltransferase [Deltaproteobacteria bacterium]|nr:uroporphyrinogen-III C-methyltransferase [Deltaproteobacteria bacterium]